MNGSLIGRTAAEAMEALPEGSDVIAVGLLFVTSEGHASTMNTRFSTQHFHEQIGMLYSAIEAIVGEEG